MNVLIIYAHPNHQSFNYAVLEQVEKGLRQGGHQISTIDLYQDHFDPALVFAGNKKRTELINDPNTEHYRALIVRADHLVFIYPVWWYSMPAILKGFFDRVFVSGFAYTSSGKHPQGLLADKSAWVLYTIDSPSWFVRLFRRSMEWHLIKDAILGYCGIKQVRRMMFTGLRGSSEKSRQQWLNNIYTESSGI